MPERRRREGSLRAIAALVLALGSASGPTGALAGIGEPEAVGDLPLNVVGHRGLFNEERNDWRLGHMGAWRTSGGRMDGDALVLSIEVDPPLVELPIQSGPAVLYAGFNLYGDLGGDVGAESWVEGIASSVIPACDDADCHYATEVRMSTGMLGQAIEAFESGELSPELVWVEVELTLVRTFGAGTWLQVLPLLESDGLGPTGTFDQPAPTTGNILPFGLFPAALATPIAGDAPNELQGTPYAVEIEALRRAMPDDSRALAMAPAAIHVTLEPNCSGTILTVHTLNGDRIWDADRGQRNELAGTFAIPPNVLFTTTLHDGGIAFDQNGNGTGIRGGLIASPGGAIDVEVRYDCAADGTGRVEVRTNGILLAAASPTVSATPEPTTLVSPSPRIGAVTETFSEPASMLPRFVRLGILALLVVAVAAVAVLLVRRLRRR